MARMTPEEVFSSRARSYVTSTAHDDPEVLSRVVALCGPKFNDIALDIGTGTMHTALAVAPRVKVVFALDVTREMIEQGNHLAMERGIGNIIAVIGDAGLLPFPDRSFDIVTCRRAAHHFPDLMKALAEAKRVLRPGGRLVIDDRSVPDDGGVDDFINELDRCHDPSHVRERSAREWNSLLESTGLDVVEVQTYSRSRSFSSYAAAVEPERKDMMLNQLLKADEKTASAISLTYDGSDWWWEHFFVTISAKVPLDADCKK